MLVGRKLSGVNANSLYQHNELSLSLSDSKAEVIFLFFRFIETDIESQLQSQQIVDWDSQSIESQGFL